MNLDYRRSVVQRFCEGEFVPLRKTGRSIFEFYPDSQIASLKVPGMGGGGDVVEINKISQDIPKSISSEFDRHFLYSQYIFNDLCLLKISIESNTAFILLIQGLLDDGWDNSGTWLEIFDETGVFLDAGFCFETNIRWKGSPLDDGDFNGACLSNLKHVAPMWSEEILAQYAVKIENDGSKVRYIMP